MIEIKAISGELLLSVPVLIDSVSREELMVADYVQVSWSSMSGDKLPVGSYILHEGEKYSLLEDYFPTRANEAEFKYTPQFHSRIIRWQKIIVPIYTYEGDGTTVKSRELDWNFTGTPSDAMYIVRQTLLHESGEEWNVVLADGLPETISLSSQSSSVWSILSDIAEACETEWWTDKSSNTLYLSKCRTDIAVTLEVGANIKTPSVMGNPDEYFTRFYAFGSSRNVTQSDSAVQGSIINKRLTLDPKRYPGGYKDAKGHFENGVFVSDLHPDEVFAMPLYFEGIFPSSKLVISNVRRRLRYRLDSDGNKVKIGGTDENPIYDQYAIWYFQIEGFEFSEELIIAGQDLSVHFKSGQLRGREFTLAYHAEAKDVSDPADVEEDFSVRAGDFEILFDEQTEGFIIPGTDYIVPSDLDEVVLFNIEMPSEYTESAMLELESELDKEIARRQQDNKSYEFDSNPVAFYENGTDLRLGQNVSFINDGRLLETRVMMVEKHLDYPFEQKIRVGNEIVKGSRQQLRDEVRNVGRDVNRMREQGSTSTNIQRDHTRELMLTQRSFANVKETLAMLADAIDGFSPGINPITLQTMAILVGSQTLQFTFIKSLEDTTKHIPAFHFDQVTGVFSVPRSFLMHYTIGVTEVTTAVNQDNLRKWEIDEFESDPLTDGSKAYYLYATVPYEGTGSFLLSESSLAFEAEGGYNLLVGVLNTEYEEVRSFVPLYGYTEVLPGQITTDVIRSADGNTYFDLVNGIISGKIDFKAGSTGLENVVGDMNIGNQNMLRNSGFTGDYLSEQLADETVMDAATKLYNGPLEHWDGSVNVTVVEDEASASGYAAIINGVLTQQLYQKTVAGESYVLSFKAKGTGTFSITVGGTHQTIECDSEDYEKKVLHIVAQGSSAGFAMSTSDAITICDLQLERGTVATAWGNSTFDNSSDRTYYQALKYLSQALAGSTTIAGGLVLTNLIQLGNHSNDSEFVEKAGASGLYVDDNSPAFWAGGTMAQAIETIMKYRDDPAYQPTDEELSSIAKFVVTHGGRAILNDIILRGAVYSKAGKLGNLNITEEGIEVNTEQGGKVVINPSGIILYGLDGNISGTIGYCGGSAISAVGRGGIGSCPRDDEKVGVYASSAKSAFFCNKGRFVGLRTATRVISEQGSSSERNRITELDTNVLVHMASGTCYINVSNSISNNGIEDGQEYIIETMGASLNITSGSDNIYSMYSGRYFGSADNPLTHTTRDVLRFKYYADADIWTCTIISKTA